jgi:hypothetical protein
MTKEEMERQHQDNHQCLEALGGKDQKQTTEDTIWARSPSEVHFDMNPELLNTLLATAMNRLGSEPSLECWLNPPKRSDPGIHHRSDTTWTFPRQQHGSQAIAFAGTLLKERDK